MKIGLIGTGYWGPKYVSNFSSMTGVEFVGAFDLDPAQAEAAIKRSGRNCKAYDSQHDLITDCDAIVVATPASTHYQIVMDCLIAGKHVLCEKMLTLNSREHRELKVLARDKGLVLLPGYTYLHHGAVQEIRRIIDSGRLGAPVYATATRTNYGPMRNDVNALQDLAAHDLSIFLALFSGRDLHDYFLLNRSLVHVRGLTAKADAGTLTIYIDKSGKSVLCQINVSWHEPGKTRRIVVAFERGKIEFDDTSYYQLKEFENTNDPDVGVKEFCPAAEMELPLTKQCRFFVDIIKSHGDPSLVDLQAKADLHLHISEVVTAILE